MIFEGYKAKLAMTNNRSTKIQPNIDEDFSGVAQIIHYCATLGRSTGIVNGAVILSHHLSPDVSNLITSLFNGPGPV
jgi:hypothetical protein